MQALFSKTPYVKVLQENGNPVPSFSDVFWELFAGASKISIAVGYASIESMAELHNALKQHTPVNTDLLIGMPFFEGLTKRERHVAGNLHEYLKHTRRGAVYFSPRFKYHGKIYGFSNNDSEYYDNLLVGSSNLSDILAANPVYESNVWLKKSEDIASIQYSAFMKKLFEIASPFDDAIDSIKIKSDNTEQIMLSDKNVTKVSMDELFDIKTSLTDISFEIPLKATPKSNLNVSFGKGRQDQHHIEHLRPWYEAELIVSKEITTLPGYPCGRTFTVITDDQWCFQCYTGGDYCKNLRSKEDLSTLGRWIKGRLEIAGLVTFGEKITENVLDQYGRNTITFTKTRDDNIWFMDMGVRQ